MYTREIRMHKLVRLIEQDEQLDRDLWRARALGFPEDEIEKIKAEQDKVHREMDELYCE